jgi:DNA-binding transcriptional MerR regulator
MPAMLAPATAITRAKSPEAFRTISEVASDLDVPQHVLRFWETRFAQVKPIKRAGGRRYYRPEDVDLLRGIRALLYADGFTIKGVQKILRDKGLRYVAELGRGSSQSPLPTVSFAQAEMESDEPRYARAAMAVLARAVEEPRENAVTLAEEERVKLEILLAELLQLKAKVRAAQAA